MEIIGIIAEYNPFHNGHIYHINKIKEMYPDSILILVLNGYFLERGEISLLTKENKAKIALDYGVNIVLELPFIYGTQSADTFANMSIKLLNKLNVNKIIFGSECADITILEKLADTQLEPEFGKKVKAYLDEGINYPTALAKATNIDFEYKPNDLLGISYIKAIKENKFNINWNNREIPKPNFIGIKEVMNYTLSDLRPYIDWTFFFIAWEMKKLYPDILEDSAYGKEAKKIFNDANKMLDFIEENNIVDIKGVFGIFKANSNGDNIELYNKDKSLAATFNLFREQRKKNKGPYLCLSDFIAPKEINKDDYLGGFIVTTGLKADEYVKKLESEGDSYNAIMLKLVCDRLAEAFAEKLHEDIRKNYWGYAKDENLSMKEIFKASYRGIRPAFGYPSLIDQSQMKILFNLLNGEKVTGVKLTESYMMDPVSSVCGLYFASEDSRYFNSNFIDKDQAEDYANRCGLSLEQLEKALPNILSYK